MGSRSRRYLAAPAIGLAALMAVLLFAAESAFAASNFQDAFATAWGVKSAARYTGGSSPGSFTVATANAAPGESTSASAPSFSGSSSSFSLRTGSMSSSSSALQPTVRSQTTVNGVDMTIGTPRPPCGDLVTCLLEVLFPPAPTTVRIQADAIHSEASATCGSTTTAASNGTATYTNLRINGQAQTPSSSKNIVSHQFGYTLTFNFEVVTPTNVGGRLKKTHYFAAIRVQRDGDTSTGVEVGGTFVLVSC
jgi:hypothetical protein